MIVDAEINRAFLPAYADGLRYIGLRGGRGSGKSHDRAGRMVDRHVAEPGLRSVCIRENQKSLQESAKFLIESKIEEKGVGPLFRILNDKIVTPGGGVIIFQGMQDHTKESIKSLEAFNIAWVEEAQTLSKGSLDMLRPTIRSPASQLWFTWNPRRKADPVDKMFRDGNAPTHSVDIEANYSENKWFPAELEQERLDCLRDDPDQYAHIWGGDYVTVVEGSYFAKHLALAKSDGRIGRVGADPHLVKKVFIDIGGTGAKSDAFTMWVCQFVGREIRVLDYYEAQGQPVGTHLSWLRKRGYESDEAEIILPHDGTKHDMVYDVTYETAFRGAGYKVTVVPNQGTGAATQRIEAARKIFGICWFNEETTAGGRDSLGWYHEKIDENRQIGLGPEHDWASHGADAFGLMAVVYKPPRANSAVASRQADRSCYE